jgi:hypothetical protein
MTLIEKANTIDFKNQCLTCGFYNMQEPDMSHGNFDWICNQCQTRQLAYLKAKGFRYYAFLLSGSWTSKYIYARSLAEAYKRAVKLYQGKNDVIKSYLVGGVDSFVLDGWYSFE